MSNQMKTFLLMIIEYVVFFVFSVTLLAVTSRLESYGDITVPIYLIFALKMIMSTIGLIVKTIKFFIKKRMYPIPQRVHIFGTITAFFIMVTAYGGITENLFIIPLAFIFVGSEISMLALSIMFTKRANKELEYAFVDNGTPVKQKTDDGAYRCEYCGTVFDGDKCPGCGARKSPKVK